jgi:hypothetical protein
LRLGIELASPLSLVAADSVGRPPISAHLAYALAGEGLLSDLHLQAFTPADLPASTPAPPVPVPRRPTGDSLQRSRLVRGWIAGATRVVICRGEAGRYRIDIAGIGRFTVDASAGRIGCDQLEPGVSAERFEEVLLGPPIAFALAGRDVWCLHASAVLVDGRAVLFLGHSGQGKSTLAAFCDGPGGLPRIADDITPCAFFGGRPCARPHFPQLKLTAEAQYPVGAASSVPIGALVFLDPNEHAGPVRVHSAPPVEALKRLAGQTVAVGLFGPLLHQAQLRFAARLLAAVPAFLLQYPHDYDRLGDVCSTIVKLPRRRV